MFKTKVTKVDLIRDLNKLSRIPPSNDCDIKIINITGEQANVTLVTNYYIFKKVKNVMIYKLYLEFVGYTGKVYTLDYISSKNDSSLDNAISTAIKLGLGRINDKLISNKFRLKVL